MNPPNLIVLVALVALVMGNNGATISAFSSVAPSLTTTTTTSATTSASASASQSSASRNGMAVAPSTATGSRRSNNNHNNNNNNNRKPNNSWLCSTTTPDETEASFLDEDDQYDDQYDDDDDDDGIIPITVISGFLGSGKTTLLTHLLENKSGDCPVGIVVNDVADVNIDGKLVRAIENAGDAQNGSGSSSSSSSDGLVQLENGCACCALSDELLTSISELVTLSDLRKGNNNANTNNNNNNNPNTKHLKPFKHIVVELSGVSDPRNIRATFQEAEQAGMALMDRARLDTLVTVVDAELFETYFRSEKKASIEETPELFGVKGGGNSENEPELEEWMKDVPPELLRAILGHNGQAVADADGVADLLVGQTETADVILLNKCDLLDDDDDNDNDNEDDDSNDDTASLSLNKLGRLRELVRALNPRPTTKVLESSYGRVPPESILGVARGDGVAVSGAVDDHREFVRAAAATVVVEEEEEKEEVETHSHSHSHDHSSAASDCNDPVCTDPTHDHSHSHDHSTTAAGATTTADADAAADCTDPVCTDPTHDHSSAASDCNDPVCTDPTHDHSHSHDHSSAASDCNDPGCTDPTHDHDHSHSHSHSHSNDHEENSTHAGIGSFVYRARRPFHPKRMLSFLRTLPIVRGIPEAGETDSNSDGEATGDGLVVPDDARKILNTVLRSKGFVWCADSHSNSMYWSHAGASFEYKCLGQWWATLPRNQWPEGVDQYVLEDFDDAGHPSEGQGPPIEQNNDDGNGNGNSKPPETVGDRRQEVVFIGLGFGRLEKQRIVRETLDRCLLTDEEYDEYRSICYDNGSNPEQQQQPDMVLRNRFPPVLESEYVNY